MFQFLENQFFFWKFHISGNDMLKSEIKCKILKIKDGRNFVMRHARAILGSQTILTCEISFHRVKFILFLDLF